MTKEEIQGFIDRTNWVFAKTYAKTWPHEYILKERLSDQEQNEFDKFVTVINRDGVKEKFHTEIYTYFYFGEWKYWAMGEPDGPPDIINRAKI